MTAYDWNEYESNGGVEDMPLFLSSLSQQLILAAMQSLESRGNWLEVSDAVWDDIDAAIAEAYEEIMEIYETIPPMLEPNTTTWQLQANQAFAANVETAIIWDTEIVSAGLPLHPASAGKTFTIPATGAGYYTIIGTAWFAATAAAQLKTVYVYVNSTRILTVAINELLGQSIQFATGIELVDNDEITIAVLVPVAGAIVGNTQGITSVSIARGVALT